VPQALPSPEPPHGKSKATIHVNSPNWDKNGRQWQGSMLDFNKVDFVIDDDNFWAHVKNKEVSPDVGDRMEVQCVYCQEISKSSKKTKQPRKLKPSDVRVKKVLFFNREKISDPCSEEEMNAFLKNFSEEEAEPSFFDLISARESEGEGLSTEEKDQ
jgi:hypothetical protein